MHSVVKRNKKTLLGRIAGRIRAEVSQGEQRFNSPDIHLFDDCTSVDDAATIAARRQELKSAIHDRLDTIIVVDSSS